jgi:hypothetical protein
LRECTLSKKVVKESIENLKISIVLGLVELETNIYIIKPDNCGIYYHNERFFETYFGWEVWSVVVFEFIFLIETNLTKDIWEGGLGYVSNFLYVVVLGYERNRPYLIRCPIILFVFVRDCKGY